jgi:hypothetical protein
MQPDPRQLAEEVRTALLSAALRAYEEAAMQGLCAEGAWEVAVGAMRALDLSPVITFERPVNHASLNRDHRDGG